ncbi:469_t:CDS:2, partial [Dentiscutata erythropus]
MSYYKKAKATRKKFGNILLGFRPKPTTSRSSTNLKKREVEVDDVDPTEAGPTTSVELSDDGSLASEVPITSATFSR